MCGLVKFTEVPVAARAIAQVTGGRGYCDVFEIEVLPLEWFWDEGRGR